MSINCTHILHDLFNKHNNNSSFSEEEMNIYKACLLYSQYDFDVTLNILKHKLYLTEEDKNYVRKNLFHNYHGHYRDFQSIMSESEMLQLTSKERYMLINDVLSDTTNYILFLSKYYNELTDEQRQRIFAFLSLDTYAAQHLLNDTDLPINFRLKIFHKFFKSSDYMYMFSAIFNEYTDAEENNHIRLSILNQVMQETDNIRFFGLGKTKYTKNELAIIAKKYYNCIFHEYKPFRTFFNNCIMFSHLLKDKERIYLVNKLKNKRNAIYLNKAKDHIKFTESELDIINALILKQKLID